MIYQFIKKIINMEKNKIKKRQEKNLVGNFIYYVLIG